jgi:hypothetical protein
MVTGPTALRSGVRAARLRARAATAPVRALPHFLVIGAQKAGTTSLYAYLSEHPDVLPAARKEVHFFDLNYGQGERWYRSMFPLRAHLAARSRSRSRPVVTGEASPYYLFHPMAAERAAALVPDAKLVVLLRDPVERAWSHYRHEVAAGREPLGFAAALDAEPGRLAGCTAALRTGPAGHVETEHRIHSYISRGMYADQLRGWLEHYPRSQLLVLVAEDLFGDPAPVWRRTVDFLGLVAPAPPAFAVHNPGPAEAMDPDVRARMAAAFEEANQDLENLLGLELPWT